MARPLRLLVIILPILWALAACGQAPPAPPPTPTAAATADLSGIKEYLLGQTRAPTAAAAELQASLIAATSW